MRTLDKQYLATHPEGDDKAEFTLAATTPEGMLPLNPDGTRQQVTVNVVADTYFAALAALPNLREDPARIMGAWLGEILPPKEMKKAARLAKLGIESKAAKTAGEAIHEEYLTFTTGVRFELTVNGKTTEQEVELTIKAPSVLLGVKGFLSLTTPSSLQNAAIAFCPEIPDEDGDYSGNEVLVR